MEILLINLSLRPESKQCIFPIGLGYIATAIDKAGFKFDLLDMDLKKDLILPQKKYNVYIFGCIITGYKYVKKISKRIRQINPKALIICGNTVTTEILLKNTEVDIGIVGEGDKAIVDILKKRKPSAKVIKNLDTLPFINWDLFDVRKYIEKTQVHEPLPLPPEEIRAMPVSTARGCLYKCTFCYHAFYNTPYRYRSVKNIGKEIDLLKKKYGINYVFFCDDLTLFNRRRAEEFAEMMTGKGVFWTADCRADLFKDLILARKLKNSNCVSLGYSLESANEGILKAMNKRLSLEDFSRQKRILDAVGIATLTSIVVGFPEETEATLKETFDFCYDNDIYPSTGYLLPQPGSPMYQYALDHDFITDEEEYLMKMGDRQDLRLNMTKMSNRRLEEIVHHHLTRIKTKLKLDLPDLIKTGVNKGR